MNWIQEGRLTTQSEVLPLRAALLKRPDEAFACRARIAREWRSLGYRTPPDFHRAVREYDAFVELLSAAGVRIHFLPAADDTGLDSLYPRDGSCLSDRGVILCRMGKAARSAEPRAQADVFRNLGVPVLGRIEPPGTLEGGDVAWLDPRTLAAGRSYRSNPEGLRQLRRMLGSEVEILRMEAPHWNGPDDVFHLMSVLSPVSERRLLVFSPLLPVSFREALLERGFQLVETARDELDSLGCNALALGPDQVLLVAGNPKTRRRLERAGVEVLEFSGREICLNGSGGPTCLTRTLLRASGPAS